MPKLDSKRDSLDDDNNLFFRKAFSEYTCS